MSVYIYTLPKAGTYFLASLLKILGMNDTGYHISKLSFLDTARYSLERNARTPGVAKVKMFFVPMIRQLKPNDVAFGHFPLPLNPDVAQKHTQYICSYRHPQKTLVSEFIDFRFRRHDVPWLSFDTIPEDTEAFTHYLERHGTTSHQSIFQKIVLYHSLMLHPLVEQEEKKRVHFVNFDNVLSDSRETQTIAEFVGRPISEEASVNAHAAALSAGSKTKAVDVDVDRAALWSEKAHAIYEKSKFPDLVEAARKQGMSL